jgi:hypothetical protein
MSEVIALTEPLNRATALAMQLEDQSEREAMLRSIGSMMDVAYVELMRPIISQYPDLDPDRDQRT